MTKRNTIIVGIVAIVILLGIFVSFKTKQPLVIKQAITSFEECKNAGYPIMESYPEQCRTPEGLTFTRIIDTPLPVEENPNPDTSTNPTPQIAQFGKAITLSIGQGAKFGDGFGIHLKEINDSRCKPDVQCIWAGELSAVFTVWTNQSASKEIRLGTTNNKNITYGNYIISLASATEKTAMITVTQKKVSAPAKKCYVGGCSAQLCSDQKDLASTCEYREQYACYKTATCEVQPTGQCGWTPSQELSACLGRAQAQ